VGWADSADKLVILPTFTIELRYTRMGDANLDRTVNSADAIVMARNYVTTANPTWDQGNFNFDSTVNFADATILQKNYNLTATGSVVPGVVDSPIAQNSPAVDDDPISRVKKTKKNRK
jgi:hypothetical protein